MPRMPWLRLYTEIIDDPKLRDFTGDEFRCWIYLLCLARESDRPGFVRGDAADLAWRMRRPVEEVQAALEKARARGMVRVADGGVEVVHFLERQYDHPSDAPGAVRQRVRRHRGGTSPGEEATLCNDSVTTEPEKCNDPVTTCNDTDADTDTEEMKEKKRGEETGREATGEGGGDPNPDGDAPPASRDGSTGPKTRAKQAQQDARAGGITPAEAAVLAELAAVPGYPRDPEKDLALVRALAAEFPDLDLAAEARRWRTYKLDRPLSRRSNPRLQFRNWCEVAARRSRDRPAGEGRAEAGSPADRLAPYLGDGRFADVYLS